MKASRLFFCITTVFSLCFLGQNAIGQNEEEPIIIMEEEPGPMEEEIFIIVEEMPEFPGGQAEMYKYLQENITYPKEAKEKGAQGTVYVSFIVEKDGKISTVKILRSVHELLDQEAVRVVSEMPQWTPGKQRQKNVRVEMKLPIKFSL